MSRVPSYDVRAERGRLICDLGDQVRRLDDNEYAVRSQSGKGEYSVRATEAGWLCSCPDFVYRQVSCKHIHAVEFSRKFRKAVELGVLADFETTDKCVYCGSKHIVKDGQRHNKAGDIQKWACLDCGDYFSVNIGFERMKHNPKAITMAMQLYFGGASLRSTQRALALQGVNFSHVAILGWIRKYVGLMQEYVSMIGPQVSDVWRADELWVKVKGDMKYLFAVMDDETRYWIAQDVSNVKQGANASRLFMRAKKVTGKEPTTIITDALPSYVMASNLDFPHATHVREIALSGRIHNNKMERMNGEVRDREKTMRGLKREDTPILKGHQLFHNYIRPHEGLGGRTPSEMAGIRVEGENKWVTLIQNARKAESARQDER